MLVKLFEDVLENLDYFWVFILMTIESSFIPFPSEVVVIPGAYMACEGNMSLCWVILVATLGGLLGATINYVLAMTLGRKVVYAFAASKWGHLCLIDEEKVKKAEDFFVEHGVIATLVGRLIPGIRQLISVPAGLAKMNFAKFALFTFIGAGVWNAILAYIGVKFHDVMDKDTLIEKVEHYSHEVFYGIVAIAVLVIAYLIFKNRKKA